MLDTIITVEMTCDQAFAILAAIKYAMLENNAWLKEHDENAGAYGDVVEMNHIMSDLTNNIVKQVKTVNENFTDIGIINE